jgi:AcrR family transcriptional regulator
LYRYFGRKDALLGAVAEHVLYGAGEHTAFDRRPRSS